MSVSPTSPPTLKNYVLTEQLGAGTYGVVYKAHRKTGAREVIAVKCVQKKNMAKVEADAIVSEIGLLKKLKHEFIVEMVDFNWDSTYIYIMMEYCGLGDLSRYIKIHKRLPERVCQRFLQQLGSALKFMRSKNIAHMDLKPQNILLTRSSSGRTSGPILKLADFGFAQKFTNEEIKTALRGSPLYMAPEMVLERCYDAKVDLWSVGVILYECLFGRAPYKSETIEQLLVKIKTDVPIVVPNDSISDSCHDLLTRCLQRDPTRRIDFEDFFNHDFIDLEHLPCEENHVKVKELIAKAVKLDKANESPEEALGLYKAALEYLVPLMKAERNETKKGQLRKRVDLYMKRAEELKKELGNEGNSPVTSFSMDSPPITMSTESPLLSYASSSSASTSLPQRLLKADELLKMCNNTPALKTAVEIAHSAELYDREGQTEIAAEKYTTALGLLLPLLSKEPKGERKTLLSQEIKRWMSRAETIKALKEMKDRDQDFIMESSNLEKNCSIS